MAWAARLGRVVAQLPAHTPAKAPKLQWIPASVRNAIQSIPAEEVLFFISDEKHAHVQTAGGEALIRKPISGVSRDEKLEVSRSYTGLLKAMLGWARTQGLASPCWR